jgi:hypothetical protein
MANSMTGPAYTPTTEKLSSPNKLRSNVFDIECIDPLFRMMYTRMLL